MSVTHGGRQPLRRGRFSIPMRGNEAELIAEGNRTGPMFSIPMRGNESRMEMVRPAISRPVFDPHEG